MAYDKYAYGPYRALKSVTRNTWLEEKKKGRKYFQDSDLEAVELVRVQIWFPLPRCVFFRFNLQILYDIYINCFSATKLPSIAQLSAPSLTPKRNIFRITKLFIHDDPRLFSKLHNGQFQTSTKKKSLNMSKWTLDPYITG